MSTASVFRKSIVEDWWENKKYSISRAEFEKFVTKIDFFPKKSSYPHRAGKIDDCYFWTGFKNHDGYGIYSGLDSNSARLVHRIVYEITKGKITDSKMEVRHICNNRECCNPEHLMLGTAEENALDKSDARYLYEQAMSITPSLIIEEWNEKLNKLKEVKYYDVALLRKYENEQKKCFKLLKDAFKSDKVMDVELEINAMLRDNLLKGMSNIEAVNAALGKSKKYTDFANNSVIKIRENLIKRRMIGEQNLFMTVTKSKISQKNKSKNVDEVRQSIKSQICDLLCEYDKSGCGHSYDWIVQEIARRNPTSKSTRNHVTWYENLIRKRDNKRPGISNYFGCLPKIRRESGYSKTSVASVTRRLLCQKNSEGMGYSYKWIAQEVRKTVPNAKTKPNGVVSEELRMKKIDRSKKVYDLPNSRKK